MNLPLEQMLGGVTRGDCIAVMKDMPARSVDFIATDPPYLVRYVDRSGRSVMNDNNDAWINPAFAQMYRVLKDNTLCISFYAWNKVDRFMEAWRKAGFHVAGHVVFTKKYASSARFVSYQHEQAYLLAKGNPVLPANPPPDVMPWTYTGNHLHPTQKPVGIFKPYIEAFTRPGDIVLDPFTGSGSTLVAARDLGRRFIGVELDPAHQRTASLRLQTDQAGNTAQPDGNRSGFSSRFLRENVSAIALETANGKFCRSADFHAAEADKEAVVRSRKLLEVNAPRLRAGNAQPSPGRW